MFWETEYEDYEKSITAIDIDDYSDGTTSYAHELRKLLHLESSLKANNKNFLDSGFSEGNDSLKYNPNLKTSSYLL
ncbi:hypothetical protein J6590_062786 [Homalodisca vitripennis]|nr:hypothetical protein J6590_062786 [Homalodisca vitripennis]